MRDNLITLFRWAKAEGYLPSEQVTAAEKTSEAYETPSEISILSPEQLRQLLDLAMKEKDLIAVGFLSFGAFTGIRSAEIARLHWKDICFESKHVEIGASKAKTASRRLVPILPNFKKWLAKLQKGEGLILKGRSDIHIRPFANQILGEWPSNCLRHSFISYRLAELQNVAQVALEAGNSPGKIFSNYRQVRLPDGRLVTAELAKKWFSIVP